MNDNLEKLPTELIFAILERCDLKSVSKFSQLNTPYTQICQDQTIWKTRILSGIDIGHKLSPESLEKVCALLFNNNYKKFTQMLVALCQSPGHKNALRLLSNLQTTCLITYDYKQLLVGAMDHKLIGYLLLFNTEHHAILQDKTNMAPRLLFLSAIKDKCLDNPNPLLFYFIKFSLQFTPSIFSFLDKGYLQFFDSYPEFGKLFVQHCKGAVLNLCIRVNNIQKVRYILTKPLNQDELKNGLKEAALHGRLDLFNELIKAGANPSAENGSVFYKLMEHIFRNGLPALEKLKPFLERLYELIPEHFPKSMHRSHFGLDETYNQIIEATQLFINQIKNKAAKTLRM